MDSISSKTSLKSLIRLPKLNEYYLEENIGLLNKLQSNYLLDEMEVEDDEK